MKPAQNHIDTKEEMEVYLLQEAIRDYGGDPGPSDGQRGPRTNRALSDVWMEHLSKIKDNDPDFVDIPRYAKLAVTYDGLSEIPGSRSNPTILAWIRKYFSWAKDDGELAWCSIFINIMLERSGMEGTGKANARSFLRWGKSVAKPPHKGDIVVFWRGSKNSWKGHVAIYWSGYGSGTIKVFGGNQRNKACFANYPEGRVLDYRRAE